MTHFDKNKVKPSDIEDNILNLKIISQIKENDKLFANQKIIQIDPPSVLQGVNRWYYNEGRHITLDKLTQIINESLLITEKLLEVEKLNKDRHRDLEEDNTQIFQNFIIHMTNSLLGLENLKKTYTEDIMITSQIDLLLKKITVRIDKMTKLFSINI